MRCSYAHPLSIAAIATVFISPTNVPASFHLMQIEQVIGGVNGDTSAQAIQLRMRDQFEYFVSQARIYAYDASGAGQILLKDLTTAVTGGTGRRILLTSENFPRPTNAADFVMTNLIPPSYFNGGRITFESDFGGVYWSLAFGGANYTGSTTGQLDNDPDGNFGPPFGGPLPSSGRQALLFQGTASAQSAANATDYAVTSGPAIFTNNSLVSFQVPNPGDTDFDGDVDLSDLGNLATNYGITTGAAWTQGNFDHDQDVDLNDLGSLATNYGAGQAQALADFTALTSVPEPSTLITVAMCGLGPYRRRRNWI